MSSGDDIVIGDNGLVMWDVEGRLTRFASSQIQLGDNDLIAVGDGANIVIGGFGADQINSGNGAAIVLADNGEVTYTVGTTFLLQARTSDLDGTTAGDDRIQVAGGNNLILAGLGADQITAGSGNDLVIGDNGQIDWTTAGGYSRFQTSEESLGGADTIDAGDGENVVLGGFGADLIVSGIGADLILGDNGLVDYTGYDNNSNDIDWIESTATETGGNDAIGSGSGSDIVIGGSGADRIDGGSGDNLVLGDNARIFSVPSDGPRFSTLSITLGRIESLDLGQGGSDSIRTEDGHDLIIAGLGNDTISSGSGNDLIFGDQALVWAESQAVIDVSRYSVRSGGGLRFGSLVEGDQFVPASDYIDAGAGNDFIFGQQGADTIDAGDGNDIVYGGLGGDTVVGGHGDDLIFGDAGDDSLYGNDGSDTMYGGIGNDSIYGGTGNDFLIGNDGNDRLYGEDGNDTLWGDAGNDLLNGGRGRNSADGGRGRDSYRHISVIFGRDQKFGFFLRSGTRRRLQRLRKLFDDAYIRGMFNR